MAASVLGLGAGHDSRWTGASDEHSDGFLDRIMSWSSSFMMNQDVLKLSGLSWITSSSENEQNRKGVTWVWPRFKKGGAPNSGLVGILQVPVHWGSSILSAGTITWNRVLESSSRKDERYLILALLLFILILFLWTMLFRRTRKMAPSSSAIDLLHIETGSPPARNRSRTTSFDLTAPLFISATSGTTSPQQRERSGTETSFEGDQATKPAFPVIMGPLVGKVVYKTHTPPLSWAEASKKLLPKDTKTRSQKQLVLKISDQTLTTQGVNSSDRRVETYSVGDISLHVKGPVEGAVLEIYVKNEPKHEWVEHTFPTALDAAQFQFDLLGCQVLGSSIQYMYDALEVVHKGSEAHDGTECLLHDCEHDEKVKKGAVAWDDVMRCFSGISSLRSELEHQLVSLQFSLDEEDETIGEEPAIQSDYVDKRHLLGPVDFFRLFVPLLPPTSFPQEESNQQRMEQILRRRKIVARASLLVKSYVAARVVVNHGWNLTPQQLPEGYMTKRLAYDTDADNSAHDTSSTNEYYEGTVSRDVICSVHSKLHLKERGASRPSAYQAYCLVGSHVFRLPPEGRDHPLKSTEDPVEALPSLRRIMDAHSGLDFFVFAFFPQGIRVAFVHLFVRWLPRGVDTKFDTVLDRFINGSAETRKRKLEVFMQLGPGSKMSTLAWTAIKAASTILGWARKAEAEIPAEKGKDRTTFPGMNFDRYTETRHFGGWLRTDLSLPDNYVSVTSQVDLSRMNVGARSLYQRLEDGALPASVVDFTFVLEGQEGDELPERAMASVRFVHIDPVKIALPTYYSAVTRIEASSQVVSFLPDMAPDSGSIPAEVRSMPGASAASTGVSSRRRRRFVGANRSVVTENGVSYDPSAREDADSFSDGIDALVEILQGVTVPNLSAQGTDHLEDIPVLDHLTRSDLRRYFVAADCHLKDAAMRVVQSVAWRLQTFPIDVNDCRVELQSGQFFQYGHDLLGHPVYYFQNMCLGPWRQDEHALISAVLHRLETSLQMENRNVKCTVIINMGRPIHKKPKKNRGGDDDTSTNAEQSQATATLAPENGETETRTEVSVTTATTTSSSEALTRRKGANPRILASGERYHAHTNSDVISRLVEILLDHYPERLHKALILPGDMFTVLGGSLAVRSFVSSTKTRSKVFVLSRASELRQHVGKSELSVIVGGSAAVPRNAFECR